MIITSLLLGVGLAMDAFSVSLANGLAEPEMRRRRLLAIAGTFAGFQFAMPLIGWAVVHNAVSVFGIIEGYIPWIALLLLLFIGGKMLREGLSELRDRKSPEGNNGAGEVQATAEEAASAGGHEEGGSVGGRLTFGDLMLQGVATSIDALSVGFTIEKYRMREALGAAAVIGVVTLGICIAGLLLGRRIGTRLSGRAAVLGGVILIFIGVEIWVKGIIG